MGTRARWFASVTVFVLVLVVLAWAARDQVLEALGRMLVVSDAPSRADVLVVARGDEVRFERALTAADLFAAGQAARIYISSALNDAEARKLARRGLMVPTPQDNIVRILLQRGVPCDSILLDASPPGGGTRGEAARVNAFMTSQGLTSALVVTSWFHTRRTRSIMADVLGRAGKQVRVVAATGEIGPQNWWTYRYDAIVVLEEFVKLVLQFVTSEEFRDDPGEGPAALKVGCPDASR